jgi:Ca2+-binding EF-hand superfamily protein
MPPKRKQPASAASASASKPTPKRRSKLARDNNISADEEEEIREAFSLFAQKTKDGSKEGEIATQDVRRALIALNAPPTDNDELHEILETVDPDDSGWVSYEHFIAVAALKLRAKHDDPDTMNEEVIKAYKLFTKGQDRDINLNDLKRVAKELREDVPDNVLEDMIREATGGGLGGVGMEDFEGVMRRAGVFG